MALTRLASLASASPGISLAILSSRQVPYPVLPFDAGRVREQTHDHAGHIGDWSPHGAHRLWPHSGGHLA